ncbi:MAG TPA: hypothetical protein VKV40_13095 [Ktedonobacteraceae bacterium]|nr:hypothetical protein [Ktedonobacteraceae bacterium]
MATASDATLTMEAHCSARAGPAMATPLTTKSKQASSSPSNSVS